MKRRFILYQELSESGVPRFPSWVGVRHDKAIKAPQPDRAFRTTKASESTSVVAVSGESSATTRYFEFISGTSNKFWEISQSGNSLTTRWGRIGSSGQSKSKSYADQAAAAKAVAKLIEEKMDEGYIERKRRSD